MEQPLGFVTRGEIGKVCRIRKSLYGLKQSDARMMGMLRYLFDASKENTTADIKYRKNAFIYDHVIIIFLGGGAPAFGKLFFASSTDDRRCCSQGGCSCHLRSSSVEEWRTLVLVALLVSSLTYINAPKKKKTQTKILRLLFFITINQNTCIKTHGVLKHNTLQSSLK